MPTAGDDVPHRSFMLGAAGAITPVLPVVPDSAVTLTDACQGDLHGERQEAGAAIRLLPLAQVHRAAQRPV